MPAYPGQAWAKPRAVGPADDHPLPEQTCYSLSPELGHSCHPCQQPGPWHVAPSGRLKLGRHMASDPSEADGPGSQGSQSDSLDPLGPPSSPTPQPCLPAAMLFPQPLWPACPPGIFRRATRLWRDAKSLCVRVGFSGDHMEGHFVKQLRTEFCNSKERASLADVHLPRAVTQLLLWPSGWTSTWRW